MSAQQTIEKVNLRKKLNSARDVDKNIKLKILVYFIVIQLVI